MNGKSKPDAIIANNRRYDWQALDSSVADYGAQWGFRGPQGSTFIVNGFGNVVAIGLWSGGPLETSRESIARELESLASCAPGMSGIDRRISPATWKAWQESSI